eukprot:scaffold314083_cov31-Tisochrysis_lutea.AAC.2
MTPGVHTPGVSKQRTREPTRVESQRREAEAPAGMSSLRSLALLPPLCSGGGGGTGGRKRAVRLVWSSESRSRWEGPNCSAMEGGREGG